MESLASKRLWKIDLLKTLAIFGVMCIHSSIGGLANPLGSWDWTASVFWGSLTRASVPLFLMCSGALLLNPDKDLPLGKLYSKNMLRLLVALLFWALAYRLFHLGLSHELSAATLWQAAKKVFLFRHETHLYYLHMMLLVYAFLPITRLLILHASRRQVEYFLLLWFVLGIAYPTVAPFWPFTLLQGIPQQWLMNMAYASIGYGVLGYYLKAHPISRRFWRILCLFCGFGIVFGGTLAISAQQKTLYQHLWEGMSVGVCLFAMGIYSCCMALQKAPSKRAQSLLAQCSKGSFCVYLVHVFFILLFNRAGFTVNFLPCIVSIPLFVVANVFCSGFVYFLLSKVPLVNKWLI